MYAIRSYYDYDAGFALSIPLVLLAALNLVFLPFSWRPLQKGFFFVLLLLVITSYSIHYTKLYDLQQRGRLRPLYLQL